MYFKRERETQLSRLAWWIGVIALLLATTACSAKEPKTVGLTGVVFNYSQESYAWVKINGKTVGTVLESVEPGDIGGGGGMCCFKLPEGAKTVEVYFEPAEGDGFTLVATIEKWWHDLAHYGVVHVLPGRKVVIEIRWVNSSPRKDLMDDQLKAIGLKPEVDYTGPMNAGPMQRADGVK